MAPLNRRGVPARAVWDVKYEDVNLPRLTDFLEMKGCVSAGAPRARTVSNGRSASGPTKRGERRSHVAAAGRRRAADARDPGRPASPRSRRCRRRRVRSIPASRSVTCRLPGTSAYELDPEWIQVARGWAATPKTYVEFGGRTASAQRSEIPFHVTSRDWQESDRVLAGIMTAFGASARRGADRRLRRVRRRDAGVVLAAADRRALQGRADARVGRGLGQRHGRPRDREQLRDVTKSVMRAGESEIRADGQVLARLPAQGRRRGDRRPRPPHAPAAGRSATRAFELDDYPVDGLVSGEFHVYGNYRDAARLRPADHRKGHRLRRAFEMATASLRFEGTGVRLDSLDVTKSTGTVTGAAWVGWDGNYSFDADGTPDSGRVAGHRGLPARAALGPAAVQRHRRRHVRGAALRREAARRRSVRRRRRHRPGHGPAAASRRGADDRRARGRVAASRASRAPAASR